MGFLRKAKALFHDDWCQECLDPMILQKKQLFALPMTVGHYVSHDNPAYYVQHTTPVAKKAEIPTGFYACGTYLYHCPKCGKTVVKIVNFLPVRDAEQVEEAFLYADKDLIRYIQNI